MLRFAAAIGVIGFVLAAGASAPAAQTAAAASKGSTRANAKPASTAIVNINSASAAEMTTLPGIGAKTAARIIEYRQKNGPFKKVEEILETSRSGPDLLPILIVGLARPSPEVAKSLS